VSTSVASPKVTVPGPLVFVHRTETGVTKSSFTVASRKAFGGLTD